MVQLTQGRKATPPAIANPERITRHNIQVWRSHGYNDREIGCIMQPMLKTPSEYEWWGLVWPDTPATPSTPEAARVCQGIKQRLGHAKAAGRLLNISTLSQVFGRDYLLKLSSDDLAVSQAIAAVKAHNKATRKPRVNTDWQLRKLEKMESIVVEHERAGVRLTVREAASRIGVSSGWLSNASTERKSSDPEVRRWAAELIARIKKLSAKYPRTA